MARTKTKYVDGKDRANLSVGDVIGMTCELNDISQAELSRMAGVSPSNLSDIIHGRRPIGKTVAEKIAKALGVSPAFILFGGAAPREGANIATESEAQKKNFLLDAIRKLKAAEEQQTEARPAMRSAIILITRALQPDPMSGLEPLIGNNLLAKKSLAHRVRARSH